MQGRAGMYGGSPRGALCGAGVQSGGGGGGGGGGRGVPSEPRRRPQAARSHRPRRFAGCAPGASPPACCPLHRSCCLPVEGLRRVEQRSPGLEPERQLCTPAVQAIRDRNPSLCHNCAGNSIERMPLGLRTHGVVFQAGACACGASCSGVLGALRPPRLHAGGPLHAAAQAAMAAGGFAA